MNLFYGNMLAGLGLGRGRSWAELFKGLRAWHPGWCWASPSLRVSSTRTERQWGEEVGKRGGHVRRGKGGGGKGSSWKQWGEKKGKEGRRNRMEEKQRLAGAEAKANGGLVSSRRLKRKAPGKCRQP